MEKLKIKVANVKCDGCVATIKTGLAGMQGIEAVEIDLPDGMVNIEGEGFDRQAIVQTLTELGYPEST